MMANSVPNRLFSVVSTSRYIPGLPCLALENRQRDVSRSSAAKHRSAIAQYRTFEKAIGVMASGEDSGWVEKMLGHTTLPS